MRHNYLSFTAQMRRSICSSARHQTLPRRHFGLQIVQTSTRSITRWPSSAAGLQPENPKCGRVATAHRRGMGTPDQCVNDNAVKQWHRCAYKYTSTSSLLCGCEGRTFRANVIMCQSDSIFSPAWQL